MAGFRAKGAFSDRSEPEHSRLTAVFLNTQLVMLPGAYQMQNRRVVASKLRQIEHVLTGFQVILLDIKAPGVLC